MKLEQAELHISISNADKARQMARQWAAVAHGVALYAAGMVRIERERLRYHALAGRIPNTDRLRWWLAASLVLDNGSPELKARFLGSDAEGMSRIVDAVLEDGGISVANGYFMEVSE